MERIVIRETEIIISNVLHYSYSVDQESKINVAEKSRFIVDAFYKILEPINKNQEASFVVMEFYDDFNNLHEAELKYIYSPKKGWNVTIRGI